MPKFIYTAKSEPHKTIQGQLEASSEQEAINILQQQGYFPLSLQTNSDVGNVDNSQRRHTVKKKDVVLFTRQLSSLIESGVNILQSFAIVGGQTPDKYFKAVISDVARNIKDGKSLSESLSQYRHIFSALYTAIIHAGETSGKLEIALKRLTEFLEKQEEFKNSVRASLAYPAFVLLVGMLTIIVLVVFVIPRLSTMFEDMGQALPFATRMLLGISGVLTNYWWLFCAGIFTVIFVLRRFCRSSQGKSTVDAIKLKIPVIGEIFLKTDVGRFAQTLSLLIGSGIPVVTALEVSTQLVANGLLKSELQKFKVQITTGASFSQCLSESKLFPAFVANIVHVGEEGGSLEKSLLRIGDEYEKEVDRFLKTFTRLLEPVIIVIMGLVVGFIVLAMLLPILQINLIVK
ncbi:MAG: type II secretion system F family protein [Candidatus Omnitrophica bacterium]|nr:type II secretion system F family protein [Candidatus Omnitrophota bacterium]